jgi:hypothetical protein
VGRYDLCRREGLQQNLATSTRPTAAGSRHRPSRHG